MKYFILLFLFFHTCLSFAQQTRYLESDEYLYREALSLYRNGEYGGSLQMINDYLREGEAAFGTEALYYRAINQVKLGEDEGEANLVAFITENPNHPLASKAYFNLGVYYFDRKDFAKALNFLKKTNEWDLLRANKEEFYFKRGYAYFMAGENDLALEDFKKALIYKAHYFEASSYYSGQIYYRNNDFANALAVLSEADTDPPHAYSGNITQLIATIHFQRRDDEKLLNYAESRLNGKANATNKLLNRLVGETCFRQEKYRQAVRYLQKHLDLSGNRMDAEGYYKLAFSYYKVGENKKAIEYFKLAGLERGDLGQASSFYLGQLYLKENNQTYALSAFRTVAKEGSNAAMKEEASFLIGKISFQMEQYAAAIEALEAFISRYPRSSWKREANELMAKSFLKTSDYDQAIRHLESIPGKSEELKKAYQSVTFHKGQQVFNDSRFRKAVVYFNKSVSFPVDREMASHAFYLLGDSYSMLDDTPNAIRSYQNCKRYGSFIWSTNADYGLGYLYYNTKDFKTAAAFFSDFVNRAGREHAFYMDGKLRLADCKYVLKQYNTAIDLYEELLSRGSFQRDYILFQLGLTYQLNDQPGKARLNFRNVLDLASGSPYRDNAYFQLAQSFIEAGSFQKAIDPLSTLLDEYPGSNLVPYTRSERALCYFNLDQLDRARTDYLYILDHHLDHTVANSALLGLQELIKKGEKVAGFEQYMEAYRQANPNDNSLEVLDFEAAKTSYYNQNYEAAIRKLKAFQQEYPSSSFKQDVVYFLGDSYYRMQEWREAASAFAQLISGLSSSYSSRAFDKRGRALLRLQDYEHAIHNYRQLAASGANRKDLFLANEGLMLAYFHTGGYDSALYFARTILESEWKPASAPAQAWMIKGKIFLEQKRYDQAMDELIKIVNDARDESGAEAKYLMGRIYFEQGRYKRSLETLFELNRDYGSYDLWLGRSFLLIADNYLKMNELFQAKATLNSIVENSKVPEIAAHAKEKLKAVEEEEQKILLKDSVSGDTTIKK